MIPIWPAWLQQWFSALLELLLCSGVPIQAAAAIVGALAAMLLLVISSVK